MENADTILICEGFATGASLNEASNIPTIVAFDVGNLEPVVNVIKKAYSNAKLIICGDDDRYNEINTGKNKALETAKKHNCYAIFPEFQEESKGKKATDFNDLHVVEGLKSVQAQINYALSEAEQPKYYLPEQFCVNDKGVFYIEPEKAPSLYAAK